MTGVGSFRAHAQELVDAAERADPRLSVLVRQALAEVAHYDLPIGVKLDEDTWVGVIGKKLEGINRWMSDWRLRSSLRKRWGSELWKIVCAGERVASREGLKQLGRAPDCAVKMAVNVVRLVPSVREFIRDDDGLAGSPKQLYDAMKDVGLIREDRREWLVMHPVVQDVSPIQHPSDDRSVAAVVFILRPAPVADLFEGVPRVHRQVHAPARREDCPPDRGTGEGPTVPRVRRRLGPRAVDV